MRAVRFRRKGICKYSRSLLICSHRRRFSTTSDQKDNESELGINDPDRLKNLLDLYSDQSAGLFNKAYQARIAMKDLYDNTKDERHSISRKDAQKGFNLVIPLKAYFYGFSETSVDVFLKRAKLWNPSAGNQMIDECMFYAIYL